MFDNSIILKNYKHKSYLFSNWMPKNIVKITNLIVGSKDGFSPKIFHEKCDNKGPTLVIV